MSNNQSFSERMSFTQPKAMQINYLDKDTRTLLFNAYDLLTEGIFPNQHLHDFFMVLSTGYFKMLRGQGQQVFLDKIKSEFFDHEWFKVFNCIEFIYTQHSPHEDAFIEFHDDVNEVLKKENVGFRFVDGQFVPITNEEEIQAVEQATQSPYENARNHIKKAIDLFADRENPDYANSIKESISAVESLTREITDENNFKKAIEKLEQKGIKLHSQFKQAINNLYNFTSDEDGVRHGKIGEPLQVNQATARYMLVTCSAINNFIVASMS